MCIIDTLSVNGTILQILTLKNQLSQNEKKQLQSNPLSREFSMVEKSISGFSIVSVFVQHTNGSGQRCSQE